MHTVVLCLFALIILLVLVQNGGIVDSLRRLQGAGPRAVIIGLGAVVVLATLFRSTVYLNATREAWITSGRNPSDTISLGYNTKSRFRSLSQPLGRVFDRRGRLLAGYEFHRDHLERVYPAGQVTAHIVGYWTGPVRDGVGVEKALTLVNDSLADDLPHDVTLSIDLDLQKAAFAALGNETGAVVVLDPATGEVLAAASKPGYDPSRVLDDDYWQSIVTDVRQKPLISRALKDIYSPGSSIKPLIAAAARATGTALPETHGFVCSGEFDPGDGIPPITDHGSGHGRIDIRTAMRVSCNVYFSYLADDLIGYDQIHDYFDSLGFNQRLWWNTGIMLNHYGVLQLVPSLLDAPDAIARSRIGIGEAAVKINPVHMAVLVGGISNDGVFIRPSLEKGLAPDTLHYQMEPAVADWVSDLMRQPVLAGGTAAGAFSGIARRGIEVHGKTGTADREPDGRKPSWFVSFGVKGGHRYVVVVSVEDRGNRYAGSLNAPIARRMFEALDDDGYFK